MIARRRPARWFRLPVILVAVVLIGALARAIWANGLFAPVHTGFNGQCRLLARLPGVADIEIAAGTAFIAVSGAHGPDRRDGIYVLPLAAGGRLEKLSGTPADFHPRGIGAFPSPDGRGLFLMAVNRRAGGRFSIDSFEVTDPRTAPALIAEGTIEGGLLTDPWDVAAAGPGAFYVANQASGGMAPLRALQSYGVLPGGNILYFNGMTFRVVADGLYGPRSLALTADGGHLIVAGLLSRDLKSFRREAFSGALSQDGALSLPAGPDRITRDGAGDLWVAGHASLARWRAFAADPARPSASQVWRIALADGVPRSADQVYGDGGGQIGGAGVAASDGHRLLIGSRLDGRLLDCTASQ